MYIVCPKTQRLDSIHNIRIFLILHEMLQAYVRMSTEFLFYYQITRLRPYNTV